jgi:glycosyltransferase involved in cell wall biosynthesis
MNILITTHSFPPHADGVSYVVWAHAQGFVQAGHRVTVATPYHAGRNLNQFPQNMMVKQFQVRGNPNLRVGFSGAIDEYRNFIATCDVDVGFFHCWETWTTDLITPMLRDLPFKKVLVSHGVTANMRWFWPRGIPTWLGWRPYMWWGIPRAIQLFDCVVYLSHRIDDGIFADHRIAERLGLRNGLVIPNGVDVRVHDQAAPGFRVRHNIGSELMLLSVGKFDKYKNDFGVAEAVLHSGISNATLVLIGPEMNDYARGIQRHWGRNAKTGLRLVCLPGLPASEILSAYREADIFVQASVKDTFPLVILDAMASSTPFVSTDVGCVGELPGGIVARRKQELSAAIKQVAGNPDLRKQLGAAGRKACESSYSWSRVLRDYADLINSLVGEKTACA